MSLKGKQILPICQGCYEEKFPGTIPFHVVNPKVETCVYCKDETTFGVYVWEHRDNALAMELMDQIPA